MIITIPYDLALCSYNPNGLIVWFYNMWIHNKSGGQVGGWRGSNQGGRRNKEKRENVQLHIESYWKRREVLRCIKSWNDGSYILQSPRAAGVWFGGNILCLHIFTSITLLVQFDSRWVGIRRVVALVTNHRNEDIVRARPYKALWYWSSRWGFLFRQDISAWCRSQCAGKCSSIHLFYVLAWHEPSSVDLK